MCVCGCVHGALGAETKRAEKEVRENERKVREKDLGPGGQN